MKLRCRAEGCGRRLLSDGMFSCIDCGQEFCPTHIFDLVADFAKLVGADESWPVYVCAECLRQRIIQRLRRARQRRAKACGAELVSSERGEHANDTTREN
jgi:hypothetical protein